MSGDQVHSKWQEISELMDLGRSLSSRDDRGDLAGGEAMGAQGQRHYENVLMSALRHTRQSIDASLESG